MDVRCEKCQTEYELDESRLKPGGVTVKCTNCGHMFKIRKRSQTNVGVPTADRSRGGSKPPPAAPPGAPRADSVLAVSDQGSGPQGERHWLIRLENGEQKTCRELATLQQWIVAGVVTRESLISRSGKTWKRLGDIGELGQYFTIADEAKQKRSVKPTNKAPAATMLGVGGKSGANLPVSEDDDLRSTGNFRARQPTPPPPPPRAVPAASNPPAPPASAAASGPLSHAATEVAPPRRPPTQPPPPPAGNRSTAAWAASEIKQTESMASFPQGPQGGKLAAIPDEPAFAAGRVRVEPASSGAFEGRVTTDDDDDQLMPPQRGSRVGLWIAVFAMLVIGAAAGVVYVVVFKKKDTRVATPAPADAAAQVAVATPDAAQVAPPPTPDAPAAVPTPAVDPTVARFGANIETELAKAAAELAGKDDPASLALRARFQTALAEAQQERAGLLDKTEGDKLRKQVRQAVIDAAPLAQKAQKAQPDDGAANLAMADVLRMQGKAARDVQRYIDQARAKADKRDVAIAEALLLVRDGKLADAQQKLTEADTDPGDVRPKLELALIAYAQNKGPEAKTLVDQVLATQPEQAVAKALSIKVETMVASTDPLPPEDNHGSAAKHPESNGGNGGNSGTGGTASSGGNDYDSLLARANKTAESNCTKAMDLYSKALEQKPNGVEALTGMGYCHIDAKQFASAFSKFRAALAVSSRYEPALAGVAEAYTQQGRKEQAIEAWRTYLEIYPGSAKAKKQLEMLGASESGGNAGQGSGGTSSAPTPTPPEPAPTPAPAPPPAPAPAPTGGSAAP